MRHLLTALLLITPILSYGDIDSLKSVIDAGEHDTLVCDAYLILSERIYLSNPDTALFLCQKAYDLAKQNLAFELSPFFKKRYLFSLANALNNIGFIYNNHGDIQKALEYLHESLKIKEEINNQSGIPTSLNNIGAIYFKQGDTSKALKYFYKSLKMYEETGNNEGIAAALNNIGGIYDSQGDIIEALEYYHKSLMMQKNIGNKEGISSSLNNIGAIHMDQNNFPKALEYFHKSLKIREEAGNKQGIALSLNNIGVIEFGQENLIQAFENGTRGLQIAREIGSPHLISKNSSLLCGIAKKQGNYKEALEMKELYILMRDSIKNERTQKATIRQQTKYEFEKAQLVREQEEKQQARIEAEATSRRDNLQYSIVLICLLGISILVAMLGRLSLSVKMAEGIIFFSFLILFEFLLVLADPYIDKWSGGAPAIKLAFNAILAGMIFPLHSLFEGKMKKRLL